MRIRLQNIRRRTITYMIFNRFDPNIIAEYKISFIEIIVDEESAISEVDINCNVIYNRVLFHLQKTLKVHNLFLKVIC